MDYNTSIMASYVSAYFEKTALPASGRSRVIVRMLDDGTVPPQPSATYFPTSPDELNTFSVVEYVNDVVGERYVRVATLADMSSITALPLDTFESAGADFVTAAVVPGDLLELIIAEPAAWTSDEYPTGNPFTFVVTAVISATRLQVTPNFPAFGANLVWSVPARGVSGVNGVTHRQGTPAGPVLVRDTRFNSYWSDAVTADSFVAATKAQLDSLARESNGAGLVSESYTGAP
jgi:hypothetical protein